MMISIRQEKCGNCVCVHNEKLQPERWPPFYSFISAGFKMKEIVTSDVDFILHDHYRKNNKTEYRILSVNSVEAPHSITYTVY